MKKNLFIASRAILLLFSCALIILSAKAQAKGVQGKNGKWGLMNASGKMISPFIYDNFTNDGEFNEGLAAVVIKKKSGYIDTLGTIVIPLKYDECNSFEAGGTAIVWLGNSCGLIDKKGMILIPVKYTVIEKTWSDSIVQVSLFNKVNNQAKFGLFTRSGKEVLPVKYEEIGEMINGAIKVKQYIKYYGFYILETKHSIASKYEDAKNFQEGLAAVAINKKWGFIDKTGKIVVPLEYERVSSFTDGKASVTKNGEVDTITKPVAQ